MKTLDDIFGQVAAVEFLKQAYTADRLPHGLIFSGPVGVGKATAARALAGLFLCEMPQGTHPCGRCPSCVVFDAGNHPDFHLLYRQLSRIEKKDSKARDLSVEVVREYLIRPAAHKSVLDRGKVFVIEEAETLNIQAQNAMLKTLEEPAGRTLIISLTDQPSFLLPTIRSRCQMVRFGALEKELVRRELTRRNIPADTAERAATIAEGSLGLALLWIEDDVIDQAFELQDLLSQIMAGRRDVELHDWLRRAADALVEKLLVRDDKASKDQLTRESIGLYLRLASQTFRRQLTQTDNPDVLEEICTAIDAISLTEQYVSANGSLPLDLQQLSVTLDRQFA